jgi:hypothetical protein
VYVTPRGHDLKQRIQKFLLMAVTFSQGTDDYLDDDVADKGLLSTNAREDGKSFSTLGHAWDEAFGYFGAARDYLDYSDDEVAAADGRSDWQGMHDSDDDGAIDLRSKLNFGASVNCAKRDRGASADAATDFSGDAMTAFLAGRTAILAAGDELTPEQLDGLRGHRDQAVQAWERAIAATVVHYINEVIVDTTAIGSADYLFTDHAKHWSEMKGFALGFQFNPRSPLDAATFAQLHQLMGDQPVLADAMQSERDAYLDDLRAARALLQQAYGFADANMGDSNGAGGW